MGYLNSTTVTVDAILTTKGRQLLAANDGSFRITQFALSDDEIDYTLYNPNHPSGSAFYGEAIEAMPIIEAFPDETQIMKYKLFTAPRGTAKLPVIDIGYGSITLKQGATADVRTLSQFNGVGINTPEVTALNASATIGTNVSKTVIGTTINMTGTTVNTLFGSSATALYTQLIITGRDSGARLTVPVTITKVQS